jgi:tetratricopeptide (TPR) repeat protein
MRKIFLVMFFVLAAAAPALAGFNEGNAAFERGDYETAYREFLDAAARGDALANFTLGYMHMEGRGAVRDCGRAAAYFTRAVELDPAQGFYHNGLAWLLATCPQAQCRDGKRAVASALKALRFDSAYAAVYLDTLAAAYAEAGSFDEAAALQQVAIDLLKSAGGKVDGRFHAQLESFRAQKPWRE